MKICIKCKEEKELNEFYKNKANKDGHSGKCKYCTKIDVKNYREENLDLVKERVKNYRENNKESQKEYSKSWREENKEYKSKKDQEYRENNKDILKEKKRKWREENKDAIKESQRKWRENNKDKKRDKDKIYHSNNKDKRNKRHKDRMYNDPLYSVSHSIRGAILKSLSSNNFIKTSKTTEILGCSFEEFKIYLESKFEDWMTWENRGLYNGELNYGWDIDHTIPLSSGETVDDIMRLNHYTNLRPLCSYTNRYIKKDSI